MSNRRKLRIVRDAERRARANTARALAHDRPGDRRTATRQGAPDPEDRPAAPRKVRRAASRNATPSYRQHTRGR